MEVKETIAVSETEIEEICFRIQHLEGFFEFNHPTRQMFADVREKMNGVIVRNRLDTSTKQTKWVYIVESDVEL